MYSFPITSHSIWRPLTTCGHISSVASFASSDKNRQQHYDKEESRETKQKLFRSTRDQTYLFIHSIWLPAFYFIIFYEQNLRNHTLFFVNHRLHSNLSLQITIIRYETCHILIWILFINIRNDTRYDNCNANESKFG